MTSVPGRRDLTAQTAIRGLAALLVFVAHTQLAQLFPASDLARVVARVFQWNNEAVDLFFILSGFILYYVYGERKADWPKYARARFSRIYPLYLAATAFFLVLAAVQYVANGAVSDKLGTVNVLSNLLLVQSWPWPWPALSLNYPAWSISVEAFLYLFVFPALFYGSRWLSGGRTPGAPMLVAGLYGLVAGLWVLHREFDWMVEHGDYSRGYWNAWLRGVCGFTAGYLLAVLASRWSYRWRLPRAAECLLLAGFVLLLGLRPPGALAGLLFLTPVLIYAASAESSVTTKVLSVRPLVYLGDLSYSIYVWHAPVLAVLSRLFRVRDSATGELVASPDPMYGLLYLGAGLLAVWVVAHVSYHYFELPVKAALRTRRAQG